MESVRFYHLTATSLESALPKLLEKIYQQGHRVTVLLDVPERVEYFDRLLWCFDPSSFLPHTKSEDALAIHSPIILATPSDRLTPSDVMMVCYDQFPENLNFENFKMCCVMFDGNNPNEVQAARQRWGILNKDEFLMTYWKQSEHGQWKQQSI